MYLSKIITLLPHLFFWKYRGYREHAAPSRREITLECILQQGLRCENLVAKSPNTKHC